MSARGIVSRRALLAGSALSTLGMLLGPARASAAAEPSQLPVLVCVFLRGAADGLSIVVPYADADYYRLRPQLAIPRPGEANGALDLDGRFGLHPRLARLEGAFKAGELALIHAVGSPHPTRSHFEAQAYMETAAVGDGKAAEGWLARQLQARPSSSLLRAVALSSRAPLSLRGYADAIVAPSLSQFRLGASDSLEPALVKGFERLYRADSPVLAELAGSRALGASALVRTVLKTNTAPGVRYAREAHGFADVARLIKSDVGLEAAWLDWGGWDTHRGQGNSEKGAMPVQLERLGAALSAFRADLGAAFERVAVVVMTEFGRTVRQNGTGGTDHGHGSVMLVLGGKVKGGRVLGSFPGLADEQLHERRDLAVTTDFRDVLAELCESHLGCPDVSRLFPGYRLEPTRRLRLLG